MTICRKHNISSAAAEQSAMAFVLVRPQPYFLTIVNSGNKFLNIAPALSDKLSSVLFSI
jgi:hypothetical protein